MNTGFSKFRPDDLRQRIITCIFDVNDLNACRIHLVCHPHARNDRNVTFLTFLNQVNFERDRVRCIDDIIRLLFKERLECFFIVEHL